MKYQCGFYTCIGTRGCNEDAYLIIEEKRRKLFVVADGLGGHGNGEQASNAAIQVLKELFEKQKKEFQLGNAILEANQAILSMQKMTESKMRTTVTAVYIDGKKAFCANVGDSRTYLFNEGTIVFQSIDHSAAQMAVYSGEISKEEIRCHEDKNILTRALGSKEDLKVDLFEMPVEAFDSILLCSDGFWEYVLESEMEMDLRESSNSNEWLDKMRQRHDKKKSYDCDNNTAIAVMKK